MPERTSRTVVAGVTASAIALVIPLVSAALAFAQDAGQQAGPAGMSAVAIALKMERTYRECHSYRDTGEVTSLSITDGGRYGSERPFATAFVRPDRFLFRFTDTGLGDRSSSYVVWMSGAEVHSWYDAKPGLRTPASLGEALGVAAGLSSGSSIRVPGLLLPNLVDGGATLIAPERTEDASDRDVVCLRIRGQSRKTPYTISMGDRTLTVKAETITLWIDRSSFLLRKVEESRTLDTYRSETTTTYTPEVNVAVPDEQLTFSPPTVP
ncbi:MAG: hypothetical protein ACM3O7_04180 [Acidobacteriota bacterium]